MKIEIVGGQEMADALGTLSQRLERKVLREALMDAGEVMRSEMSRKAPRRPPHPDLADNIVMSTAKGEDLQEVAVAIGPAKESFYGSFVELGTAFMSAQPYVRPAFDGNITKVLTAFAESVWLILTARGVRRATTVSTTPVTGPGRTV